MKFPESSNPPAKHYYKCLSCGKSFWSENSSLQASVSARLISAFKLKKVSAAPESQHGHRSPGVPVSEIAKNSEKCPDCGSENTLEIPSENASKRP